MTRIPGRQACEIHQTMTLFQDSKDGSAKDSISSSEILGLDRAVALSLAVALATSVLAATVVLSDSSTTARLSGWWTRDAESNVWQQVWQQDVSAGGPMPLMDALKHIAPAGTSLQVSATVSQAAEGREFRWNAGTRLSILNGIMGAAGGQGRTLPGVLLVTPAPFLYRIEAGVSIRQQLTNWSRHQGWELDWEVYETPADRPSAKTLDFGEDFDLAFASVIKVMNAERRQQGRSPLSAVANFTTGRITVRLAEQEGSIAD